MNIKYLLIAIILFGSCKEQEKPLTAQEIVDKSIEASGGQLHETNDITFRFRDKIYTASGNSNARILKRIFTHDSLQITDVKEPKRFQRFVGDSLITVSDSLANVYANAINSVHYFANLPYGLNDAAVLKKLLGITAIGSSEYYKVEVRFTAEGGGEDHEDVYVYWFNTKTFTPDYLAYSFEINGGGQRFRKAINQRTRNGIRFVDYENYKSTNLEVPIQEIDSLYQASALQLLSVVALENIEVRPTPNP